MLPMSKFRVFKILRVYRHRLLITFWINRANVCNVTVDMDLGQNVKLYQFNRFYTMFSVSFLPILKVWFLSVLKLDNIYWWPPRQQNLGSSGKTFGILPKNVYRLRNEMWALKSSNKIRRQMSASLDFCQVVQVMKEQFTKT